jgi:hypothetical protein
MWWWSVCVLVLTRGREPFNYSRPKRPPNPGILYLPFCCVNGNAKKSCENSLECAKFFTTVALRSGGRFKLRVRHSIEPWIRNGRLRNISRVEFYRVDPSLQPTRLPGITEPFRSRQEIGHHFGRICHVDTFWLYAANEHADLSNSHGGRISFDLQIKAC